MTPSSATSGFDIEFMAGAAFVRHLVQLLVDVGDIPVDLPLSEAVPATLFANNAVRRTYGAHPKTGYPLQNDETFALTVRDFGDYESDYAWFSIGFAYDMGGGNQMRSDFYFKILKDIDVQAEIAALLEYADREEVEDETVPDFDILRLFKLDAILEDSLEYDTEHPENNHQTTQWDDIIDDINQGLVDFVIGLRAGDQDEAEKFLRAQIDPLTLGALERIGVKGYPEKDRLGILVNLQLLDHKRGWLGPRGDLAKARDFLPGDAEFALATSPGFLASLVDDLLVKSVAAYQVDNNLMGENEAHDLLDGDHFPLDIPREMIFGEKDDEGLGLEVDRYQIRDTAVATRRHTFTEKEIAPVEPVFDPEAGPETVTKVRTTADSLAVILKASASLFKVFGLANENIVATLTPIDSETNGIPTADLGLDTDLRVNLLQTFISRLNPLNSLKFLTLPFISVINAFANGSDAFAGVRVSELGFDMLARLPLRSVRWDPFYTTDHGFLLEKKEFAFESERLCFSGLVHLSKTFTPYASAWVREAVSSGPGAVNALLYYADKSDEIREDVCFATDREGFSFQPDDVEKGIYRLEFLDTAAWGNARSRLAVGKLAVYIPYAPYSTRQDEHDGHRHIDAIRMLHPLEVAGIEDHLRDDWVEAQAASLLAEIEAAGVKMNSKKREEARKILEDFVTPWGELGGRVEDGLPPNLDPKVTDPVQVEEGLMDVWVTARVNETIAALEAADIRFTDESRAATAKILDAYLRSGAYDAYVEGQLPLEVTRRIYAPGTLRLALTPVQLDELRAAKILDLVGYAKVVRQGRLYFRDIADKSTKDNLLSLPEYS